MANPYPARQNVSAFCDFHNDTKSGQAGLPLVITLASSAVVAANKTIDTFLGPYESAWTPGGNWMHIAGLQLTFNTPSSDATNGHLETYTISEIDAAGNVIAVIGTFTPTVASAAFPTAAQYIDLRTTALPRGYKLPAGHGLVLKTTTVTTSPVSIGVRVRATGVVVGSAC